jgi:hypothetical protein
MTTDDPGNPAERDNLYEPREDLSENSSLHPFTRRTSLTLEAQLHPRATLGIVLGLAALTLIRRAQRNNEGSGSF